MEVGTQKFPSFDHNSTQSFPYSLNHDTGSSELRSPESRSSKTSVSPEVDGFDSPSAGVGKFEVSEMASFSAVDVDPPASEIRGCRNYESGFKPKSSAAMKVQKFYRGYRTRRLLADSAVVAEEFWWQAIDYARLNRSTISFFNFSKPETAASRWNRISLNASKVGKGLSKDAKAQKLAFQHWIEAIDPRHRYGHSLHLYYEEWCKADAGQPFFYWLDIGDGKEVDLEQCRRYKLQQQCIKYLGPQEREHYEYVVVDGKLVHKQTGNLLHTNRGLPGAKWIFVVSTTKRLYAGEKKKGVFHHSSFLAGGVTIAAGRLEAEYGTLKSISPYSGHYRPTEDSLEGFLSFLKENGVNLDEVEMRKANEDYENYEDNKLNRGGTIEDNKWNRGGTIAGVPTNSDSSQLNIPNEEEKDLSPEPTNVPQTETETKSNYKRTLSGGLQSPRADVPKTSILQRINSKKAAKSYQLGHQVSLKWSTGAGPRIGCIADYPVELRQQALEFTNLSPRTSPTSSSSFRQRGGLSSPTARLPVDINNGDLR